MSGDRLILIAKFLLFSTGLWTLHLKNDSIYTKIYKLYSIFVKIGYLSFVTTLVTQYAILLKRHDDPARLVSSLALLIIIVENATKCVLYHKKKIPHMFQDIIQNEQELFTSGDHLMIKQYLSQVKLCRKINILQVIALVTATTNLIYMTFVEYSAKGLEPFKNKAFLQDIWYPFKWENHLPSVIFLQLYYLILGACINAATLTTLVVLITFASIKLRLLQIRITNIGNYSPNSVSQNMEIHVKDLIKEHQYIISFVHSLNQKIKYVMLMEFLLNSINLAMIMMQGLTAQDFTALRYVASLLVLVVFQVFVMAWVSNEIKLQSLAIGDAVWNCKWYNQSKTIKDLLRVIILRAQKPLLLTIGPFGPMTIETALTMVKTAYTYLTVMRKSYN